MTKYRLQLNRLVAYIDETRLASTLWIRTVAAMARLPIALRIRPVRLHRRAGPHVKRLMLISGNLRRVDRFLDPAYVELFATCPISGLIEAPAQTLWIIIGHRY